MDNKGNIHISDSPDTNARKIQPLNGRNVFYYEAPREVIKEYAPTEHAEKKFGHYEKVIKKVNNYYYVNNNHPSGMPGALVVPEEEARGV